MKTLIKSKLNHYRMDGSSNLLVASIYSIVESKLLELFQTVRPLFLYETNWVTRKLTYFKNIQINIFDFAQKGQSIVRIIRTYIHSNVRLGSKYAFGERRKVLFVYI